MNGCAAVTPNAGANQAAHVGETVTLDAILSGSADGKPLTFEWALTARPASSAAVLSATTGPLTTFIPDVAGTFVVKLRATGSCTAETSVQIFATAGGGSSGAPIAVASVQPSGTVPVRSAVTLSGASSYDQGGQPITYAWTLSTPTGSAATLSSAVDVAPQFTPDVAGHYVATLVVANAHASSAPAQVAIDAQDLPPVVSAPAALYGNVGNAVTLDASASSDPDGDAISYAWSVTSRPQGSTAALVDVSAGVVRLVPDVAGSYVVRVTVSDSAAASSQDVTVTVWRTIKTVTFRPIDVEYDRPLDRIVAVADQPPALHLYDAAAGSDVAIPLPVTPTCVSVSPDGKVATVGHAAWVSVVDLEAKAVLETWPTTVDAGDIVVTNSLAISGRSTRFAYVYPSRDQWSALHVLDLGNGAETQGSGYSVYAGGRERLQPGSNRIFLIELGLSPQQLYRWDFSTTTGSISYGGESPYWGDYGMGSNLWISDDGTQILMAAGTRFRTSDMTYAGKLPLSYLLWADAPAAPSAAAGMWLVQPGTDPWSYPSSSTSDLSFWTYDSVYLANPQRFDLPKIGLGTAAFPLHGRYAFFDRAGTTKISIAQVDANAAVLNDYAVLTF